MTAPMSIRRAASRKRWTTLDNRLIEDARLGPTALAIMVYLLSKPDDWTVMVPDLCSRFRCKEYKIRAGLQQMEAAGYAKLEPTREPDGTLGGRRYTVSEDPIATEGGKTPTSEKTRCREKSDVGEILPILNTEYGISDTTEAVKTVPKGTGAGTNGVPAAPPLAAHTNGSTQPEPLASPGLSPFAVNGASPAAAGAGEPHAPPAPRPRSARNGKASANGSTHAEPDPERAAESKLVFGELCAWLKMDSAHLTDGVRGRLNKIAKSVLDADLDAEVVRRARLNWSGIWPGTLGQAPTYGQMETQITQAGAVPATTNFDEVW